MQKMDGWTESQARRRVMILKLDLQYTKSYMKNFSSICQRTKEKSAENCVFPVF